jgi:replication-associated recombination protein RarA
MIYPSNFTSPFLPESLDDFVISDSSSRKQLEGIVTGKLPVPLFGRNAICLWGSVGTGKSTLALILPQLLERSGKLLPTQRTGVFESDRYWDLTECGIEATSVSHLSDLQERCKSGTGYSPSGWHYEILDEVDLLKPPAQAALKSAITFANSTIFIFTTNYLNKVDEGIKSRSVLIEMNQSKDMNDYTALGRRLLKKMGLTGSEISDADMTKLAKAARGDIRDFGMAMAIEGIALGGNV